MAGKKPLTAMASRRGEGGRGSRGGRRSRGTGRKPHGADENFEDLDVTSSAGPAVPHGHRRPRGETILAPGFKKDDEGYIIRDYNTDKISVPEHTPEVPATAAEHLLDVTSAAVKTVGITFARTFSVILALPFFILTTVLELLGFLVDKLHHLWACLHPTFCPRRQKDKRARNRRRRRRRRRDPTLIEDVQISPLMLPAPAYPNVIQIEPEVVADFQDELNALFHLAILPLMTVAAGESTTTSARTRVDTDNVAVPNNNQDGSPSSNDRPTDFSNRRRVCRYELKRGRPVPRPATSIDGTVIDEDASSSGPSSNRSAFGDGQAVASE